MLLVVCRLPFIGVLHTPLLYDAVTELNLSPLCFARCTFKTLFPIIIGFLFYQFNKMFTVMLSSKILLKTMFFLLHAFFSNVHFKKHTCLDIFVYDWWHKMTKCYSWLNKVQGTYDWKSHKRMNMNMYLTRWRVLMMLLFNINPCSTNGLTTFFNYGCQFQSSYHFRLMSFRYVVIFVSIVMDNNISNMRACKTIIE